jgi:hypothetical protein
MTKPKKEEHEFWEMLKNATIERCPDCGCENVETLEPLSQPDDDFLCECKNKKCQFTWAVSPDPTKVFSTQKKVFSTQKDKDCYVVVRKDLGYIVWMFKNKREYNRIKDLNDTVIYSSKLLSQYGFNAETGEWDLKRFPVTQRDAQMEGIRNDFDTYVKAQTNLNEYTQYLSKKYDLNLDEVMQYGPCRYWLENMWL